MSERNAKTGIQSIEVGTPLLAALADSAGQMTLTALAKAAGMTVEQGTQVSGQLYSKWTRFAERLQ